MTLITKHKDISLAAGDYRKDREMEQQLHQLQQSQMGLSAEGFVGLFTLVSIIVLLLAYTWFKSIPLSGFQQRFGVSFSNVAGLRANSPINVNGVRVGTVDQVSLQKNGRVLVVMRIDPNAVTIRKGAQFNIETFGLIGAKYVDITLPVIAEGQPLPPVLDEHTIAAGEDPVSLSKVADKFEHSLDSFDLEGSAQTLQRSLAKLELMENSVSKTSNKFGAIAQDIRGTSKKVNEAVDGADLKQTLQNLQSASGKLDTVAQQAHQILDKKHPLLHMTFGRPGHIKAKKTKVVTNHDSTGTATGVPAL